MIACIFQCEFCKKEFKRFRTNIKKKRNYKFIFCSRKCLGQHKTLIQTKKCYCSYCGNQFIRKKSAVRSKNIFCSQSCSGTYNNTHKKHGTRRSKLEVFLESELKKLYPDLEIHFNRKDTINCELDIFIPSIKLAIEINGIHHYKPIYGVEKLKSIQKNDDLKQFKCAKKGIKLQILNISSVNKFNTKIGDYYFEKIVDIIKLNTKFYSIEGMLGNSSSKTSF